MNVVVLMGRLTRDPDVRYTTGEEARAIARYTLAVDRRFRRDGDQSADFITCVAFGRSAEFAEKYLKKGSKITVNGRIQTGSYTNRDGVKVYTTEVVVDNQEFAESKAASEASRSAYADAAEMRSGGQPMPFPEQNTPAEADDGFMNIPEGIDEELPFN